MTKSEQALEEYKQAKADPRTDPAKLARLWDEVCYQSEREAELAKGKSD